MKINALRLHNVKRFAGAGVAIEGIGDGVNVLSAANEQGKSTCFEALHALFFQPHTGVGKAAKMLQPYSGGSPMIEADITTGAGRFRLAKQFFGGKRASVTDLDTGRLTAQADEAEAFIGELIRDGNAGPAGLLWVRQGMTGIEKRSTADEENDKRVRENLLTSVQGEVEALTGGRRMKEISDACEEELYKLVTATLRPKAGGRYAAAIEERDKLLTDEARLGQDVTVLRSALDQRRNARVRLAELENADEDAARKAAVTTAELVFETAKSHGEMLKAANAEARLAANRRDAAKLARDQFEAALLSDADLRRKLTQAEAKLAGATERRLHAIAADDRVRSDVQTAEQEERDAQTLMKRLDAAMRGRQAAEELIALRNRLELAEASRKQVEDADASLALLVLPKGALEQLETLELKIFRLQAATESTLPTFAIDYLTAGQGGIRADGQPVVSGQAQSFADSVRLEIPGIGGITLRSNRPPQADAELEASHNAYRKALTALGLDSLASARLRAKAASDKAAELERARQRLQDLAPKGLQALHVEIARLAEISGGDIEFKADAEQARHGLDTASIRVGTARNLASESMPIRLHANEAVVTANAELASITQALAGLEATLGQLDRRAERSEALSDALTHEQSVFDAAEAKAAPLRLAAHDLESAEAALRRARSVQKAAEQEASQLRETLAGLNAQILTKSDSAVEEAWLEARDQLVAANARVERFDTEVKVLNRLRQALATTRSAARDLYLKPVMTELSPLLGLLFDDISIAFDESTLLPQVVRRNGQDEDVERLSGGMREQLSVLTRLAFARLLAKGGRPAPVILDDALVYSDDDRIEKMFDALHRQSKDQQILVFSCRQRAFARLGGNVLQMVPWQPEQR